MKTNFVTIALLLALTPAGITTADDLGGHDQILCSLARASQCFAAGDCQEIDLLELNIPPFIEIDLAAEKLKTTEASQLNRETPIQHIERQGPYLILQGVQQGRAWSVMLDEEFGDATIAVAAGTRSIAIFGACTPLPGDEPSEP